MVSLLVFSDGGNAENSNFGIGPLRPTPAHPGFPLRGRMVYRLRGGIADFGNNLSDLGVSAVKTYAALPGLARFFLVSRASPLVEVFRPVGAGRMGIWMKTKMK